MATPASVAADSTCWRCVSNYEASVLYLLGQITGMADPATVSAAATCWDCISNKQASILYLLDQIAAGGGGGGGATDFFVTSGTGPPASSPAGTSRWYVDLSNGATYYSDGVTWTLKS